MKTIESPGDPAPPADMPDPGDPPAMYGRRLAEDEARRMQLILRHRQELTDITSRHRTKVEILDNELRDRTRALRERFVETAELSRITLDLQQQLTSATQALHQECERGVQKSRSMQAVIAAKDQALHRERERSAQRGRSMQADITAKDQAFAKQRRRLLSLEQEITILRQVIVDYRHQLHSLQTSRMWKWAARLALVTEASGLGDLSDEDLLRRSTLFDAEWYRRRYPDVDEQGADPVRHYLQSRIEERRDPGPTFSSTAYLAIHPDVEASGINPLLHYLRHGIDEGRSCHGVEIEDP